MPFIPAPPSIPCEFLGGVGFLFSLFLDFSPQEQGIILARNSAVFPFFLRRYSIVTPSLLHRKSIVSMEYLWRTDGQSMEYPLSFKEGIAYLRLEN